MNHSPELPPAPSVPPFGVLALYPTNGGAIQHKTRDGPGEVEAFCWRDARRVV